MEYTVHICSYCHLFIYNGSLQAMASQVKSSLQPDFVGKVLWNTLIHLQIIYGCFDVIMAELSGGNRDQKLKQKCLLTFDLQPN